MSNIVNIGIQQNGIENVVPKVIRASELEKINIFLNEEEKALINDSYELIEKNNSQEYKDYLKKYPALEGEELYLLNTKDKEIIEEMNSFLGRPMLIIWAIENGTPGRNGSRK